MDKYIKRCAKIVLVSIFIVWFTGCSEASTRIIFKGESINWSGELDTTISSEGQEDGAYRINYKNNDWKEIQNYKMNINDGRIIREETGMSSGTLDFPIIRTTGSDVSRNEDQMVVIEWTDSNDNHFEEKILLRAQ